MVDASRHSARARGSNGFMFGSGASRRYVGEVWERRRIEADSSLPGGESGVLGSPFYTNLLSRWLTNDTHPLRQRLDDVLSNAVETIEFVAGDDEVDEDDEDDDHDEDD